MTEFQPAANPRQRTTDACNGHSGGAGFLARWLVPACSVIALSFAAPAFADALSDASRMLKQGQHAQALDQLDKFLATKPKDAQGRFLKGIVLTEMNRLPEAITVFTRLTEDYPELPEPYNNLAVIYAQQKNFDKARQALEMAIRTHPSYATAHENLGDIYAKLASQAYDKALQIDSSNASAQSKLALIRDLMSNSRAPRGKPTTVADATPVEPVKPVEVARPVEPPKPAVQPVPVAAPVVQPPSQPVAAPAAPVKPATDSSKTVEASAVKADVTKAVDRWVTAWSKKDVKAYLAAYAKEFKTPGGESRSAWESDRKKKIDKPGGINVSYENLQITLDDSANATAKFRQHYKSAGLKTSSNKTLQLVRRDNTWLIVQEKVGH